MKILFLIDNLIKGGRERRMISLIQDLLKKPGVLVELVIFRNLIEYPEINDLKITLHIIERKPKYSPLTFLKLYRICKQVRPDVIHSWSNMTAIFVYPSVKILNIKLLNSSIANAPFNPKIWQKEIFWTRLTFPFSDVVVGNSEAGLKAYRAPKSKSVCIPNGFDFNRVKNIEKPNLVKEKYEVGTNAVVGKIAAFAERKDYSSFIAAANLIAKERDDVIFFAVGQGPNFEHIKTSVPQDSCNKIVFTGQIPDVESLINIFDIGILCTNNEVHGEGISNSIMEYMALGKPVIASEGGGTNEIVLDGETGFLVPTKSPRALANKILELLENPAKAVRMGMAGRKRIHDYFEIDKMTCAYFQIYNTLVDQKKGD